MTTIPASQIVNVNPGVVSPGGNALALNGLFLSLAGRVPQGTVAQFPSAAAVASYFGGSSAEAAAATKYFSGYDNSTLKPGNLLFANYPLASVGAYVRGGNAGLGLTLAQLQAINALLSVTINGTVKSGTINLTGVASFTAAATLIADTLDIEGATANTFTGTLAGGVLTVTSPSGTPLAVGQIVKGAGVTAGTYISSLGTGTGGAGTYNVSVSQSLGPIAMTTVLPAVTFDSVSGGFVISSGTTGAASTITMPTGAAATSLLLTAATGAVLSQGANAAAPSAFMASVIAITQNWASFTTVFDPDQGSGNAQKLLFAAWTSAQNNRYCYVCWDTDVTPTNTLPATASLGYLIAQANYSGTCLVWEATDLGLAYFICGAIASINFGQTNGRANLAFRSQSGMTPSVVDPITSANLLANGYNFYGAYATANSSFTFLYNGSVSGAFLWLDSFINQIWLNNQFQLALMNLLTQSGNIPYNVQGNSLIEAACADTINAGLNFGAFRAGVTPSASQAAAVNAAAGTTISTTLQTRGWYLQTLAQAASSQTRVARSSPSINFWYMDGESIQNINLSSTDVQ